MPDIPTRHRRPSGTAVLAGVALLAGCAATPDLAASPEGDRRAARRALAQAAAAGPVPLTLAGDAAPLDPAAVPDVAASGIRGLSPAFTTGGGAPGDGSRLVLWFDAPAEATGASACAASGAAAAAPSARPELLAVWCDGTEPAAHVRGQAAGPGRAEVERLVWRATGRLFPDDYPETYGLNLFGLRVRLGGSFGF